jgi:hypothetical protein
VPGRKEGVRVLELPKETRNKELFRESKMAARGRKQKASLL